jgi:hypothetical protein
LYYHSSADLAASLLAPTLTGYRAARICSRRRDHVVAPAKLGTASRQPPSSERSGERLSASVWREPDVDDLIGGDGDSVGSSIERLRRDVRTLTQPPVR